MNCITQAKVNLKMVLTELMPVKWGIEKARQSGWRKWPFVIFPIWLSTSALSTLSTLPPLPLPPPSLLSLSLPQNYPNFPHKICQICQSLELCDFTLSEKICKWLHAPFQLDKFSQGKVVFCHQKKYQVEYTRKWRDIIILRWIRLKSKICKNGQSTYNK